MNLGRLVGKPDRVALGAVVFALAHGDAGTQIPVVKEPLQRFSHAPKLMLGHQKRLFEVEQGGELGVMLRLPFALGAHLGDRDKANHLLAGENVGDGGEPGCGHVLAFSVVQITLPHLAQQYQ